MFLKDKDKHWTTRNSYLVGHCLPNKVRFESKRQNSDYYRNATARWFKLIGMNFLTLSFFNDYQSSGKFPRSARLAHFGPRSFSDLVRLAAPMKTLRIHFADGTDCARLLDVWKNQNLWIKDNDFNFARCRLDNIADYSSICSILKPVYFSADGALLRVLPWLFVSHQSRHRGLTLGSFLLFILSCGTQHGVLHDETIDQLEAIPDKGKSSW